MDLSHPGPIGPIWSRVSHRAQCSGHYSSYFILMTLLATFNPPFVCLQTIVSCITLLDLKMTPVSCKMIYLLYLNGQKLGRWGLILRSATHYLSLINVSTSSPVYYLGTHLLSTVSSHTYLGITVSSNHKWHEHISNICLKATRAQLC